MRVRVRVMVRGHAHLREGVQRQHVERLLDLNGDLVDAQQQEGRRRHGDERLYLIRVRVGG